MNTHADKTQENKSHSSTQMESVEESKFEFVNNRPEAIAQRKLQEMANDSPNTKKLHQLQSMANHFSRSQEIVLQKMQLGGTPQHQVVQRVWEDAETGADFDLDQTGVWIDVNGRHTYKRIANEDRIYIDEATNTILKWDRDNNIWVQPSAAEEATARHNARARALGVDGMNDVNCYSWAWAQPAGSGAKTAGSFSGSTEDTVDARAQEDGMINLGNRLATVVGRANANNIIVAQFQGATEHWWRRHNDGTWSEAANIMNPSPIIQQNGNPADDAFVIQTLEQQIDPIKPSISYIYRGFQSYYLVPIGNGPTIGGGGCCFISTACTEAQGLPDDCLELTVLRDFRDNFLLQQPNGSNLFALYYKYSPMILKAIGNSDNASSILNELYTIIQKCVKAIEEGKNDYAFDTYCHKMIELAEIFIPDKVSEIKSLMKE